MNARWCVAALALSGLAACGPLADDSGRVAAARDLLPAVFPGLAEEGARAGGISREDVVESSVPVLLGSVVGSGTVTPLQLAGANGTERTFIGGQGVSLTLENGLLVASRGLGADLMGADVAGIAGAIAGGGGVATRVHDYLDGSDRILRRDYRCRVEEVGPAEIMVFDRRYATTRYDESCAGGGVDFRNTYWIDASGVIRKSRQLVSPPLGYVDLEQV